MALATDSRTRAFNLAVEFVLHLLLKNLHFGLIRVRGSKRGNGFFGEHTEIARWTELLGQPPELGLDALGFFASEHRAEYGHCGARRLSPTRI